MMKNETKKQTFDRSAGVLMSISSLPSDYGIGTMGKAAYEFADFVRACNHKYWQVLPIGKRRDKVTGRSCLLDRQATAIPRISHFPHLQEIRIL